MTLSIIEFSSIAAASTHPYNLAIYHINKIGLWYFGQPRHTHHLPTYGYNKACTPVDNQIVHINIEIAIQSTHRCIIGKGVLRFGHTDR
jgi:hypothetical protein